MRLIYYTLLGLVILLSGCGPVTAIALFQNNTDLFELIKQINPQEPSTEKTTEKKAEINEQP